jgi:P27 family predicted phage terminase small subunit
MAVLPAPASAGPPEPPAGLLVATRDAWATFWGSPLAGLVVDSDLPALERLFQLYDERARAWRGYKRRRLVEGSQGQPVASPLFRVAMALESEIRPLEDRFGVTPAARLKLGIRLGEAARSLEDLVRDLDDDGEERRSRILGSHYQPPQEDPGEAG